MTEVEVVGDSGEYDIDLIKIALKKKDIVIAETMLDHTQSTNTPPALNLNQKSSGTKTKSTLKGKRNVLGSQMLWPYKSKNWKVH